MKKCKKAIPETEIVEHFIYSVKCPHCKTILRGGFSRNILRCLCTFCSNPIDLYWQEFDKSNITTGNIVTKNI